MLKITTKLVEWMVKSGLAHRLDDYEQCPRSLDLYRRKAAEAMLRGDLETERFSYLTEGEEELTATGGDDEVEGFNSAKLTKGGFTPMSKSTEKLLGDNVRLKKASERYSDKSFAGRHSKTGEAMFDEMGREVREPSERNYALTGALFKHLAYKSGLQAAKPDEHEAELLAELCMDREWAGDLEGQYCSSIKARGNGYIKALLDDSTSGGLEIAPIHFDDDVVSTPQLSGELWPFVGQKEVARGRRVEGASIANVTVSAGEGMDNSEMTLFNTAALVAAIDISIHSVGTAVEVGRDFLSDAAVDVGRLVTVEIGKSMLAWLDEQVAIGDGTLEPEGIMTASGTTAVAVSGATSVDNYESLRFAVPKAQQPKGSAAVRFCGTETSYMRARAIPVGAADARRVFGMDHESYTMLLRPYAISTAMTNAQLFFGDLANGYRAYRRVGGAPEVHTQGDYLARRNLALIVYRARYGGKVVLPSSFGVVTDAPA